jgi:nuclear transport factor 2 (NTF2) superfamily protein
MDEREVRDLARRYTEAWCSQDPVRVAAHYGPGGMIAINGGEPTPIEDVARSFIESFPDIQVFMDDLAFTEQGVAYRWTFTGTSSETGKWVRIPGVEIWTIGEDGLIAASKGAYDEAEYERQLEHGAPA